MEYVCDERGIKITTKNKYWNNYKEFVRTCMRLGFKKSEILIFPTPTILISIWMIDCMKVREFILIVGIQSEIN